MANFPNANDLTQRFALDVQGFDSLRRQANASPAAGMKQVATQFDAMFSQMMLKSMRDATPQDGVFDSNTSKLYTSMLDQQLSQQMASRGIGVADALMKQMMRAAHITDTGGAGGNAAGGLGGALGAMGGDEGGMAATNALAQALANARGNGRLGGAGAYTGASSLTPPVKGNGTSPDQDAFVGKVADAAQAASSATGIPARFIVGQAALESGWGKREIRGRDGSSSYNVFGIKATKNWTGRTVSAVTTEYVGGQPAAPRGGAVPRLRFLRARDDRLRQHAQEQSALRRRGERLDHPGEVRHRHAARRLRDRSALREEAHLDPPPDRLNPRRAWLATRAGRPGRVPSYPFPGSRRFEFTIRQRS